MNKKLKPKSAPRRLPKVTLEPQELDGSSATILALFTLTERVFERGLPSFFTEEDVAVHVAARDNMRSVIWSVIRPDKGPARVAARILGTSPKSIERARKRLSATQEK